MSRRPPEGPSLRDSLFVPEAPKGNRHERLEHLLFEEIARLFRFEIQDPRVDGVSIVSLELSPDLRNATIRYAVEDESLPEKQRKLGLDRTVPFLRAKITEALSLKKTPALHFQRDRVAESSSRAVEKLSNVKPEEP